MNTCDRCGPAVAAPKIVSLPSGGVLTFCLHCTSEFRAKLEADGAIIYPQDDE